MSCLLVERVGFYRVTGELSRDANSSQRYPNAQAFFANTHEWELHGWDLAVLSGGSTRGTSGLSSTGFLLGSGAPPR